MVLWSIALSLLFCLTNKSLHKPWALENDIFRSFCVTHKNIHFFGKNNKVKMALTAGACEYGEDETSWSSVYKSENWVEDK